MNHKSHIPRALKIDPLFAVYSIKFFVKNTRDIYGPTTLDESRDSRRYDSVFRFDFKNIYLQLNSSFLSTFGIKDLF